MKGVTEHAPTFYSLIQKFGWGPLLVAPLFSQVWWAQEFYALLPTVQWDSPNPTIHIRGVDILVDARSVNNADSLSLLRSPVVSVTVLPFHGIAIIW